MTKVVFFGTPDFAIPALQGLIDAPHIQIQAIVTAQDKPAGRGRSIRSSAVSEAADRASIRCLTPELLTDPAFLDSLKDFNADLFIVIAFRKLPDILWQMPKHGTFNLHASLLPELRGAAPIHWAIAHGLKSTGMTAFFINDRIDTGDIIDQQHIAIQVDETLGSLYQRLSNLSQKLTLSTIEGIMTGQITAYKQAQKAQHPQAPKIGPSFQQLDNMGGVQSIHNRIRACDPSPGASLMWPVDNSLKVKLFSSSFHNDDARKSEAISWEFSKESLRITGPDGCCEIGEIQYPGKRKMAVSDFLRGMPIQGNFPLV